MVGAAVVGVSLVLNDVVGALTVAYDLLTGALFVPIVLGLLWPRGTGRAAFASIAVSSVVIVVLMFTSGLYSNDPIMYGLLDEPRRLRRGEPRHRAGARRGRRR